LRGEFPSSELEFFGHARKLNHRKREFSRNADPGGEDAHKFPSISEITRRDLDKTIDLHRNDTLG
jgi:hypothetical protein